MNTDFFFISSDIFQINQKSSNIRFFLDHSIFYLKNMYSMTTIRVSHSTPTVKPEL